MSTAAPRYLIFALPAGLYALDSSQVAEVCEPKVIWPVPAAPSCYQGATVFRGNITAVMDLAAFMGQGVLQQAERLIVLTPAIGSLAFLVQRVLRTVPADQVSLRKGPDEPFVTALLLLEEGEARLLDAEKITNEATATIND